MDLSDAQLRDFESSVCDSKGCWVYFDKIVPHEEEEKDAPTGGKKPPAKAPPKGKPQTTTEEAKPTHGRAWLNLT